MPRKRATRNQTTRAKPELQNLGDDIVYGMAPSEREEKLASFIKDLDLKVEGTQKKLKDELKHIEDLIIKSYYHIRLSLSARERGLTLEDYIAETTEKEKCMQSAQPEPEKTTSQTVLDTISKYKSIRKIEPILEEDGGELTVKKPRKGARGKATAGVTFGAEPTPFTNRYVTPATTRNASALGWNTPLVTPKFDPRLPVTPAQKRQPHMGEVVISMAGSPIEVNGTQNRSRAKTLQIAIPEGNEAIEDFEIPDNISNQNLKMVMNLLSNVMKKKEQTKK